MRVTHLLALSATTRQWVVWLYVVAFVLQATGVGIVVRDIIDDVRTARDLAAAAQNPPTELRVDQPGASVVISGVLGAAVAQTAQGVDTFRQFTTQRLTGSLRRRAIGVGALVTGLGCGTAASVLSVY